MCSILSEDFDVSTEVPVCQHINDQLRADLKVHKRGHVQAQHTVRYYDLTVVEPQCASALSRFESSVAQCPAETDMDTRASIQLDSLVNLKYGRKLRKYHNSVVPLVITSDGYFHGEFTKFIDSLSPTTKLRIRCAIAKFLLNFRAFRYNSRSPPSS